MSIRLRFPGPLGLRDAGMRWPYYTLRACIGPYAGRDPRPRLDRPLRASEFAAVRQPNRQAARIPDRTRPGTGASSSAYRSPRIGCSSAIRSPRTTAISSSIRSPRAMRRRTSASSSRSHIIAVAWFSPCPRQRGHIVQRPRRPYQGRGADGIARGHEIDRRHVPISVFGFEDDMLAALAAPRGRCRRGDAIDRRLL